MWKIALILCLSFSGCLAVLEECSSRRCEALVPELDMQNPDHVFPSADRLVAVCPKIMAAFDCLVEEFRICTDRDLSSLSASDNETIVGASKVIMGNKELMEDLCDTTTPIHEAYVKSVGCIKDTMMAPMAVPMCAFEAKAVYGSYKIGEDENEKEQSCMVAAHVLGCISMDIFQNCGEEARATFVELVKRSQFLKYAICTPEHIANLKTAYLDYLALESERHSVFEKVFDMRRRRK